MKRTTFFKVLLDASMLALYLLLMFGQNLGGFFHEAAGLSVGVAFIIHVCINRAMTKGLLHSIRKGSAKAGKKLLLFSDIILTVCMPVVLVTGILIAKELFFLPELLPWSITFTLHNILSYVCLGAMALHLLLHIKYLAAVLKKLPSSEHREIGTAFGQLIAIALAAVVIFTGLSLYGNADIPAQSVSADVGQSVVKDTVSYQPPEEKPSPSSPAVSPSSEPVQEPVTPAGEPDESDEPDEFTESDESDEPAGSTGFDEPVDTEPEPEPVYYPSLEEYMSELSCSGCRRHCSLLNPRCSTGAEQAAQAEAEYYQLYGDMIS